MPKNALLPGDMATRVGLPWWKFNRLQGAGLFPEAIKAGRFSFYPADSVDAIRQRLIEQGHIKPAAGREVSHVG